MRDFIFAANWKLNKSPKDAESFFKDFAAILPKEALSGNRRAVFFVPAMTLTTVVSAVRNMGRIEVGLQNAYWEAKGAFTGENSALVAKEIGATWVLIGHSERRTLFGESDADTAKKVKSTLLAGLKPMLCVGESLAEREAGKTMDVVARQILSVLSFDDIKEKICERAAARESDKEAMTGDVGFVIAYEPVWAIGTGKVATPEQASEVHQGIRKLLNSELGPSVAERVPILYGGSVKPDNSKAIGGMKDIDGFLVGGASLEASSFAALL